MNITIVGTGYVGLVTGTCLSDTGNTVFCIDNNKEKVNKLLQGEVPIYEPGLDNIITRNVEQGNLFFSTELEPAVKQSDLVFLALPTPPKEDGSADLSYIFSVARELCNIIDKYTVIVVKSTVPIGTGDKVEALLSEYLDTDLFDVVSNPEFLREGAAIEDFMNPDRVIVGTDSERAMNIMRELYLPLTKHNNSLITMQRRSSEMSKYAANCFLATKISFMNEIATLCDRLDADIDEIRAGIGSDTRIGEKFLYAGIGYGGSCFPKDVKALIQTAAEVDYTPEILLASEYVNRKQKTLLVKRLQAYFKGNVRNKTIAIWGGAFKPDTDDIREAPAVEIIKELLSMGVHVKLYDPEAMPNIKEIFGELVEFVEDKYDAVIDADALLVTTEWKHFRTPNFSLVRQKMAFPLILDGRNIYNSEEVAREGFVYQSIGRPTKKNYQERNVAQLQIAS